MSYENEVMETSPDALNNPGVQDDLKRKRQQAYHNKMEKLLGTDFDKLSKKELTEVLVYQFQNLKLEMSTQLRKILVDLESMKTREKATNRMMQSFLQFQGQMDAKVDVALDQLKLSDGLTDREVEDLIDRKLGLVRRTDGVIEEGDVVYLDYEAEIVGEEGTNFPGRRAESWPVRVGAGSFHGEEELEGKPCEEGYRFKFEQEYPKSYSNTAVAGKKVRFDIEILKVKVASATLEARNKNKETKNVRETGAGTGLGVAEPTTV